MNLNHHIDNDLQYQYYLNSLRAYKRPFQKWFKKEEIEDLDVIMDYYDCSSDKAREILSILTEDQIREIRNKKGGIENGNQSRRTNRGQNRTT
jgi:redox-regulated HSP33 family molecular chaperone